MFLEWRKVVAEATVVEFYGGGMAVEEWWWRRGGVLESRGHKWV